MFRRRQYLINPKFQLTLIAFFSVLALAAIVVYYAENLFLLTRLSGNTETEEILNDPVIREIIAEERGKMQLIFSLTSGVVLFMMVFGGLILSNRVAGPLFRLQKHMKEIMSGETKRKVAFREKDFFPELAETYNELLVKVGAVKEE